MVLRLIPYFRFVLLLNLSKGPTFLTHKVSHLTHEHHFGASTFASSFLISACSSQFLTDGRTCSPALSCSTPFTIRTQSSLQQTWTWLADCDCYYCYSRGTSTLYYTLAHTQRLSRLRNNPYTRERTRSPFRQEGNLLSHRADVCMIFHSRLSVILRLDRGKSLPGHLPFIATSI